MKKKRIHLIQYNAPVTLTFSLISLFALFLGIMTDDISTIKVFCVYRSPLNDPLTYIRFFTHVLGHSSFAHYSGNITLLLILGPNLEERYGSKTILGTMVMTAFISGVIQWLLFPNTALLGASGIVFMMIVMASLGGAEGVGIPLTLVLVFVIYVGGEVYEGLTTPDNISQLTHIIGGICGAVMGLAIRRGKL